MATLPPDFKKNLESAIIEHGRFACPNIECTDWITSKEFTKKDGSKFLEYYCTSSKCAFHSKEIIPLNESNEEITFAAPSNTVNIKRLLVGFASILLIMTVTFGISSSSSEISKKENTPTVENKRIIVLSTPVFRKEN